VKYEKTVKLCYQRRRKMQIYWESHQDSTVAITLASFKEHIEPGWVMFVTKLPVFTSA